jgi:membrane-bound serine protease (ClpP class)
MTEYLTVAFILIGIGVLLVGAEVVFPTGGFLIVGGLLFIALGVGLICVYGDTMEAAIAMAGVAVGLPVAGFAAVSAWRRMSLGRTLDAGIADASVTNLPQIRELEHLRGRFGKTVSTMRPSGSVEFDGRRVDAMTEGMMLEAGVWVKCVDVKGGKVVVREMDQPTDLENVNLDNPHDLL